MLERPSPQPTVLIYGGRVDGPIESEVALRFQNRAPVEWFPLGSSLTSLLQAAVILLRVPDSTSVEASLSYFSSLGFNGEVFVHCDSSDSPDVANWYGRGVTGWSQGPDLTSPLNWLEAAIGRQLRLELQTARATTLNTVLNRLPDQILLVKREGRFTGIWPPGTAGAADSPSPLTLGQSMIDALPPSLLEPCLALGTRAWELGVEMSRLMLVPDADPPIWLDVRAIPLDSQTLLVCSRDVTSQQKDRQQLERHRRLTGLLQQMTNSGHWEWSRATPGIWFSPSAASIFGLDSFEWTGTPEEFIGRLVFPADRIKVRRSLEALRSVGEARVDEFKILRPDGESRIIWSLACAEFDEHRAIQRAYGAIHDVTNAVRVREELRAREIELAEIAKVSVLGLLSSQITHELNQPLYSISNYAEACRLRLVDGVDDSGLDEILDWLDRIGEQARSTGEAIRRMTRLLQRRTGIPGDHDLISIVQETIPLFAESCSRRSIVIEESFTNAPCLIRCDRVMIRQVVAILLTNAVEAIEQRILDQPKIKLTIRRLPDGIELGIQDNGCGLPHDRFLSFCRPFVSEKADAMGIGLAIAKAIVDSLHGRIWAEAGSIDGADIRLLFPAV